MLFILESHRCHFEFALTLDVNPGVGVDQDIGNRSVLEERLNGSKPQGFVDDIGNELVPFLQVKWDLLFGQQFMHHFPDLELELIRLKFVDRGEIYIFQ